MMKLEFLVTTFIVKLENYFEQHDACGFKHRFSDDRQLFSIFTDIILK